MQIYKCKSYIIFELKNPPLSVEHRIMKLRVVIINIYILKYARYNSFALFFILRSERWIVH